jgi:hypothetical protein
MSGCSISILSDVLYVSPEERTGRAVKKIYGEIENYETIYDVENDSLSLKYDFGYIDKIYEVQKKRGTLLHPI